MALAFEDVLEDVKGNGKFIRNFKFLFVIPVSIIIPWFWMSVFFMVSIPDHWCDVPAVRDSNLTLSEQRSLISPPSDSSCSMYDLDYDSILKNGGNFSYSTNQTKVVPCKSGWQYDKTNYDETVVTKWDLVCNRHHYISLIFATQKIGNFIGTPVLGFIADKIGRKTMFFVMAVVVIVTEAASIFLSSVIAFIVWRVIASLILSTSMTLMSIFCIELVPLEYRAKMTGAINIAWTVGLSIQPILAYFTRHWIAMVIANIAAAVFILSYWKFLPESPCWLISKDRYEEAVDILKKMGDRNGKNPDRLTLLKKLQALGDDINRKKNEETFSKFNLIKYPRLRKHFVLITLSWVANSSAYGGLLYNVRNLYGNEFVNYFLLSLVELPGNVAFMILMDRCGRRWSSVGGFILSGVFCLAPATGLPYSDIIASLGGKFLVSGNFMVTDQQASELYPTVTRTFGIGASKTVASVITLFLPYIADLNIYGKEVPFVVIAAICFFTAVCVSFLPETLNENLPQTTSEAENFGGDQNYFSWMRKKEPSNKETTQGTCHI